MALRGVPRACDLPDANDGRRVRVAGMVITRQRPGTAKAFVFLTLEDETGISNVIIRPDLFDRERMTVIGQPFLIVDGVLQGGSRITPATRAVVPDGRSTFVSGDERHIVVVQNWVDEMKRRLAAAPSNRRHHPTASKDAPTGGR